VLGHWFVYADGYFTRLSRRTLWLAMSGAYAALALLTTWGLYPVSMVGMPDQTSNMPPPTVCLLVLAVAQTAMAMLARSRVTHWLERPRLWAAVVRFASMAMTVYLWHLVLSVVATLLSPLERGRTAKATKAASKPHVIQTVGAGIGAALSSFGLLGYVASGLQPAPHGSRTSSACSWAWPCPTSRRGGPCAKPGTQEVRPAQHTNGPAIAAYRPTGARRVRRD
jgi:hypothetical protein